MLLLAASCNGKARSAPPRPPPQVVVGAVQLRDVPVEVRAPVDLRPLFQVDVGSKTLGYLDVVLVDRGDLVKRRQLLALVRPSDLPQQIVEARSGLAQAQAAKILARSNLDRSKRLAPEGVVSQQELQQATSALAAAMAAEEAARARIGTLGVRLGETRIESPIDGVVSMRRLDPGALVGPTTPTPILTLVKMDVLRVFVSVNESFVSRVHLGQDATVDLDALPGKKQQGKVVRLAPAMDPITRTLEAEVHLSNKEGLLRPGMYGRGAIVLEVHPKALTVPVTAVQVSSGQSYVFVVEDGRARRRPVQTGVDGESWLEIVSGLRAAERVIIAGADSVNDGAAVRVVEGVDPFTGRRGGANTAPEP